MNSIAYYPMHYTFRQGGICMQFILNQGNKQGTIHKEHGIKNQDAVCSVIKNDICAICLADGAGSREMSGCGASHITGELSQYLLDSFDELSIADRSFINQNIMTVINSELTLLSDRFSINRSQFASTLLFAVTDGKKYIIGHLGDGCIIGFLNSSWNVVSFPQNGKDQNCTYLTSTPDAGRHLRIQCNTCKDLNGFLLTSDGIMPEVFGDSFSFPKSKPLVDTFSEKMKQGASDDASYIACCWEN